jgi:energy-coupling factor transporter ATP-binding protein EcfA2
MTSCTWVQETERQLHCCKHIILSGNVHDHVLYSDELISFEAALDNVLKKCGYTVRAGFNPVDGIVCSSPEMRKKLDKAWEDPALNHVPANTTAYAPFASNPAPASRNAINGDTAKKKAPEALEQALPIFRAALRDNAELTSVVINFADRLFQKDDYHPPDEQKAIVQLSLIASEAKSHYGQRNALILVASNLGAVPSWIYRNNPYFSQISVNTPGREEREAYFRIYSEFFYKEPRFENLSKETMEEFVAITDGFSYHDLDAIRLASTQSKLKIQNPRRLVDYFKYGTQDDPWEKLGADKVRKAGPFLEKYVKGQPAAIGSVCKIIDDASIGIGAEADGRRLTQPKGVIFLVGPTGVGKTALAKAITEYIFHDSAAFGRFDMSEYREEHSALRLTGAPPSFVGYEAGGQLTNWVKQHPFSVILFDEIEKAHKSLMDVFLQVIDDGILTDGTGNTVYFSQSLIIFTSNIGSTIEKCNPDGSATLVPAISSDMSYDSIREHYSQAVRNHFMKIDRLEVLGRIGKENIIVFDMMRIEQVSGILRKSLDAVAASVAEKYKVQIEFDPSIEQRCIEYCKAPEVALEGYRSIRHFVKNQVIFAINRALRDRDQSLRSLRVLVEGDSIIARET